MCCLGGRVLTRRSWDEGLLDMCIGEKRTLTIGPSYGYGDRGVGPIPAGSTLGSTSFPMSWRWPGFLRSVLLTLFLCTVFETELVGIEGVPKPESIVTKSATEEAASATGEAAADADEQHSEL